MSIRPEEVVEAPSRPARLYPLLAFGLFCFSMSPILVRFAEEGPGLAVAAWRSVLAVVLLAPVALPRVVPELRGLSRRDLGFMLLAGVVLGFHFVSWIESIYHTTVASASVLVAMSPLFMALLGYVFLRERLPSNLLIAIGLGLVGTFFIGWGDLQETVGMARNPLFGNGLALMAALMVSIYLLIGRSVRQRCSWLAYVFPLYTIVAATTLGMALLLEVPLFGYSWGFYGLCGLMALGPSLTGHGSFNYAVRYLPAALLGLLTLTEPVGASVVAYLLFDEVPRWLALGGMLLVLGSIVVALRPRRALRQKLLPGKR